MADNATELFFRDSKHAYPWLIGAAILLAGAYFLMIYTGSPLYAFLAFAAGLATAAAGMKLIRQPAARLGARSLTLSNPGGLTFRTHTYGLNSVKRATVETQRRNAPNRLRRGVLFINLSGVPATRVDAFVHALRERGVQID